MINENELIEIENRIDKILSNSNELENDWNRNRNGKGLEVGSAEDKPKDQSGEMSASIDVTNLEGRDSNNEGRETKINQKCDSNEWYVEWIENSFDKSDEGSRDRRQSIQESNESESNLGKQQQLLENEVESISVETSTNKYFIEEDFLSVENQDEHADDIIDDSFDIGNGFGEGDRDENSFSSRDFLEDEEKTHVDEIPNIVELCGFESDLYSESLEKNRVDEIPDVVVLNDFESDLYSESLEKLMASCDELEDDVGILEKFYSTLSMEERDRAFHLLTQQHDQLFGLKEQNNESTLVTHTGVSVQRVRESSQNTREETSSYGDNKLERSNKEPMRVNHKTDSWKKYPLNSVKEFTASNSVRSQTRACDRLYNLAVKKRESIHKRRQKTQESEKLPSTKSFNSTQYRRKNESSKPVYERLYSLAPKRPRQIKVSQKRRWK